MRRPERDGDPGTNLCHTCETGVLSDETTYQPAPLEPPAQGNVLVCCATPTTELVLTSSPNS